MRVRPEPPPRHRLHAAGGAAAPVRGTTLAAGALTLATGEVGARVVAFLGVMVLSRRLGPAAFGVVGFATALAGYFSLAFTTGFVGVGTREVAQRPERAAALAAGAAVVRLALAAAAVLALGAVAWSLPKPAVVRGVVALSGLSFFALALDPSWVYRGLERGRAVGAALVAGQVVFVALALAAVSGPQDVVRVPLAQFASDLAAALLLLVPLLRHRGALPPDWRAGLTLVRQSAFPVATRLMRTLIFSLDVVMLAFYRPAHEIGLYTAAYRVCYLLLAVVTALHAGYLPAVTRALGQDGAGAVAARETRLAVAVAAPLVVGAALTAAPLLAAVFGREYAAGAPALRLLVASVGCIAVYGTASNAMLASGRTATECAIMAGAAVANAGLNLALIPRLGTEGAALATALTEAAVLVVGLLVVRRFGVRVPLRSLGGVLLATGAMAAAVLAVDPTRALALSIAVGAVVYVPLAVAFGGFDPDDLPVRRLAALFRPRSTAHG